MLKGCHPDTWRITLFFSDNIEYNTNLDVE